MIAEDKEVEGFIDSIKYDEKGLVPAIIQDCKNDQVLMMAYMNRETLAETIKSGRTVFWSRSRQCVWKKGEFFSPDPAEPSLC